MKQPFAIVQLTPWDNPRHLPDAMNELGIPWRVYLAYKGDYPQSSCFSGIALLGGHHSTNQLPDTLLPRFSLAEQALNSGVPLLGHCLGGQIIPKVLGAEIRLIEAKEIGWYRLSPWKQPQDSHPSNRMFQFFNGIAKDLGSLPAPGIYTAAKPGPIRRSVTTAHRQCNFIRNQTNPLIETWYERNGLLRPH